MAKRMKLWVAGALLLAVGGTVVASNMGFKFVPNWNQGNVVYTISLPLNNNYTNAASIFNDIEASCPGSMIGGGSVDRINIGPGGKTHTTWPGGGPPANNFPVVVGQGYDVTLKPPGCTAWVVVGSHDPVFSYSFSLANNYYLTSIPYHTTATVADNIFDEITGCLSVDRINVGPGGKTHTTWPGAGPPANNFPVKVGEAYGITVSAATAWTPSHY